MTRTVVHDAEPEPGLPFVFNHCCDHCRLEIFSLPGTGLLEHPAVIAFYDQCGVDLFRLPPWEIAWMYDGRYVDLIAEDPLEYAITIEADGHRLRVTLDENASVTASERTDVGGG